MVNHEFFKLSLSYPCAGNSHRKYSFCWRHSFRWNNRLYRDQQHSIDSEWKYRDYPMAILYQQQLF